MPWPRNELNGERNRIDVFTPSFDLLFHFILLFPFFTPGLIPLFFLP